MKKLKNKVAIITGGAGEIGFAAAQAFLAEGAKVMLVDLDEKALKKRIKSADNDNLAYVTADVTKEKEVKNYVKATTKKWKQIDVFFNNAGIEGEVKPIAKTKKADFEKVIAVNVTGVFLGMKHVMPAMKKNGGSIIITSSVAGLQGTANMVPYITSKHATIGIMRTAALEGAPDKIRVNSVHPGVIDSRMMRSLEEGFDGDNPESVKKMYKEQVPLQRYGKEEEIAKLVLFLASDDSSYCTGAMYNADGGLTA